MDKYAVWVKASEMDIEYGKKYHAKRVDDEKIKWVGYFQESDGVFFWCNNPGYVPMPKDQRHLLLLLDESPVDRGVEKAADSFMKTLKYEGSWDSDQMIQMFIAGAKWAGNDADKFEFAEFCGDYYDRIYSQQVKMLWVKRGVFSVAITTEQLYKEFKIWQSLKQKQL